MRDVSNIGFPGHWIYLSEKMAVPGRPCKVSDMDKSHDGEVVWLQCRKQSHPNHQRETSSYKNTDLAGVKRTVKVAMAMVMAMSHVDDLNSSHIGRLDAYPSNAFLVCWKLIVQIEPNLNIDCKVQEIRIHCG